VPGDPSQVVYVWFDALGNYVTALDYGSDADAYREWWERSAERLHVIGKGIVRFHAIYWPAILRSAGEPPPTTIFVHDYLTVDGQKLSKSLGNTTAPSRILEDYGADALRWWFLRDLPRNGDADFREELLVGRANELADGLGNLVNRTIALIARHWPDGLRETGDYPAEAEALLSKSAGLPAEIDNALGACDLRAASAAIWEVVSEANRFVTPTEPWELARRGDADSSRRLEAVLGVLLETCRSIGWELEPFLPDSAGRIAAALDDLDVEQGRTLFPKFE
jgi:methionyl-tRNA synthetase